MGKMGRAKAEMGKDETGEGRNMKKQKLRKVGAMDGWNG